MRNIISILLITSAMFTGSAIGAFAASEANHPDWPCVQRRVPTISAATMWVEPPLLEEEQGEWRKDRDTSKLVRQLAQRRVSMEEAEKMLAKYVEPLSEKEKLKKIPQIFQGVLQIVNKERAAIIDGIERYTRKQRSLVEEIRKSRGALEKEISEAKSDAERAEKQKQLDWQTRIHQDREKSLEYVCESPTLLEERVFSLARELQYKLP